jgi:glutamine amidotransferase
MLSISEKINSEDIALVLKKFQRLAEFGKTPVASSRSHKDGWGIAAYKNGEVISCAKGIGSAFGNRQYSKAMKTAQAARPEIIFGHLRKASVGSRSINNTQPFISGKYMFCQNGTISDSEKIKLERNLESKLKGETDSERFFFYILQLLAKHKKINAALVKKSIKEAVVYIRENFDFTSLNMIFSDGECVWALREINERNEKVRQLKLMDYYSLFIGVGESCRVVASEKLGIEGMKWEKIRNHELLEMKLHN